MSKLEQKYFEIFKETLYSNLKNDEKLLNIYILILKKACDEKEREEMLKVLEKYTKFNIFNEKLYKQAENFVLQF